MPDDSVSDLRALGIVIGVGLVLFPDPATTGTGLLILAAIFRSGGDGD